jgi:hypothetical protein
MRKKPVTQDAQLLLQLDRLQKESEMRKARLWWTRSILAAKCG